MISFDMGFTDETDPDKVQAAAETALAGLKIFNFTQPIESFDDETKRVYYRLRRVAIRANDDGALPDGKIYTEAQVVEILGEDYLYGLGIDPNCCG